MSDETKQDPVQVVREALETLGVAGWEEQSSRTLAALSEVEAEMEHRRAFEANVRELLARASEGGGKGPTHYCAHCLASFDGPESTNAHARTCPQSPVARENAALRAEVENWKREHEVMCIQAKDARGLLRDAQAQRSALREELNRAALELTEARAEVERLNGEVTEARKLTAEMQDAIREQARREERERCAALVEVRGNKVRGAIDPALTAAAIRALGDE